MAWASKKQYAILMGSEEGKDLAEKLPEMEQEEFQDKFAELLGNSDGSTSVGQEPKENKANSKYTIKHNTDFDEKDNRYRDVIDVEKINKDGTKETFSDYGVSYGNSPRSFSDFNDIYASAMKKAGIDDETIEEILSNASSVQDVNTALGGLNKNSINLDKKKKSLEKDFRDYNYNLDEAIADINDLNLNDDDLAEMTDWAYKLYEVSGTRDVDTSKVYIDDANREYNRLLNNFYDIYESLPDPDITPNNRNKRIHQRAMDMLFDRMPDVKEEDVLRAVEDSVFNGNEEIKSSIHEAFEKESKENEFVKNALKPEQKEKTNINNNEKMISLGNNVKDLITFGDEDIDLHDVLRDYNIRESHGNLYGETQDLKKFIKDYHLDDYNAEIQDKELPAYPQQKSNFKEDFKNTTGYKDQKYPNAYPSMLKADTPSDVNENLTSIKKEVSEALNDKSLSPKTRERMNRISKEIASFEKVYNDLLKKYKE